MCIMQVRRLVIPLIVAVLMTIDINPTVSTLASQPTDASSPIQLVGAPSVSYLHTAAWTGTEMLVWGGNRSGQEVAWTGSEMLIWTDGGQGGFPARNAGSPGPTPVTGVLRRLPEERK
jgi:hypothetical protein